MINQRIVQNIIDINRKIAAASVKSPLNWPEIMLLAVTKTVSCELIETSLRAGINVLGENRVQEFLSKYEQLPEAKWHLIGHLQTNKVKYIIDKVSMIESLDSLELACEVQKRAAAIDRIMPALVQVNIGEDKQKFGLSRGEVVAFLKEISLLPNVKIKGLMTIGPYYADSEQIRPVYAGLRELFLEIRSAAIPNIEMAYLSMGMSHDYQVAVEEGANIVRVGSAIFGAR